MSKTPPWRSGWRPSLRLLVVGVVAVINLAVFGAGYAWLKIRIEAQRADLAQIYTELLGLRLQTAAAKEDLWSTALLRWGGWGQFDDVFVAHLPELSGRGARGTGVRLNPLGAARRLPGFDEDGIISALGVAAEERRAILMGDGVALPVYLDDGRPWGGAWIVTRVEFGTAAFASNLFPVFIFTTVLMTLITVAVLRRLVLDPVKGLAEASRRIEGGYLSARVAEPDRRDELAELCRGFNAMADRVEGYQAQLEWEVMEATGAARKAEQGAMIQRRLAATGELAAGIAHEINNPLGGMFNAVESLSRADLPSERRERYLDLVRGGLGRIRDTVGQVLRLAPRQTATQATGLAAPLSDALGLVRHRARTQGVRLILERGGQRHIEQSGLALELYADLPYLMGQANELGQAILNLLVNGLDALEDRRDGEIRIFLGEVQGYLCLRVHDNGSGAAASTLERAGDLFFTTKDQGKGTGLGLAHVHSVVHGHGGTIELSSELGRFFQVEIMLPIHSREEA